MTTDANKALVHRVISRAEMQALPPIGHAVELLEQLARDRQPIPR